MKKLTAIAAAVGLSLSMGVVSFASPAEAATPKFKNCTALNAKYPGGVAKSAKVKNTKKVRGKTVPAKSSRKPKVSKSLYNANKRLDRDKDGIACER